MFKDSEIPLWVNVFLVILIMFMGVQVYQFYFAHQSLLDAGITIETIPDKNIIYTTAGRLVAMIAASLFVLVTQHPKQYLVVMFMSIFREGQETFIDPLLPYANAAASPYFDFGLHLVIVALEITAFVVLYRISKKSDASSASH